MSPFLHRSCRKLHPVLDAVFRAFQEAGVRWCLLRLPSNIGDPTGGDVDLLIHHDDIGNAGRVLKKQGFVQLPGRGHLHTHFLDYHLPTDCWIWLDIASELSFGPYYVLRTGAEAVCLARRQHEGGVAVLAPDDAFWALLLHCMLDKGVIAHRHKERLQELVKAARTDSPLAQFVEAACPVGWFPGRMVECVSRGEWVTLERFAPSLTAALMRQHSIAAHRILIRRGVRLISSLLNSWRHQGISVALLGPDGAGKSTLAMGIQSSFIFPVRLVYMGLTGGALRYVARLRVPGLVILGRVLVFWCRYLKARYHQAQGRLVIFDRYIYDAMVPHPERLNRLRRASRWMDGHACPPPDLVLVLSAPGELMYERKGSYNPKQLEDWRHHFLALRHRIPQLQIVDATSSKDAVRADVINRIWRRYVDRWTEN